MAAVPVRSLRVGDIKDPVALFEAYTAEEIRGLERRVRAEMEQKKEELRQMVGERYRDLIEAADTIGEMKLCAQQVVGSVQDMQRYCTGLRGVQQQGRGLLRAPQKQTAAQEKFYSTAAQIKLLLEIPEKIWSCMQASQYLHATQLYLLCCHLHTLLQLDTSSSRYSPILARFPILVRQVAAAGHFRYTILQESKSLLKCPSVSDQAVAEALCSIMLLEDSSPRQALTDFLLARKSAIQQLLNQPHHGASIKAQVCSLVELLATTLYQAHALFYSLPDGGMPDPALTCGLLFSTLESITRQDPGVKGTTVLKDEMKSGSWFKHLPLSVIEFQPALRTLAHPISQDYLRETLQKWIHMCNEDIKAGITTLLVYVNSLKGLAGIRDAVWELLTSESMSQNWEIVCQRLLDRPMLFWEDLLQQLFLDRLQTLTKEGFNSITSSTKQLLMSALHEIEVQSHCGMSSKHIQFEYNVPSFLWLESSSDLLPDAAWINVSNRSHFAKSGLSMKAHALTPCVQNFCTGLDAKLKVKLDDLLSYLPYDAPPPKDTTIEAPLLGKHSAFDRYGDARTVEEMLQSHCLACIEHILGCIAEELGRTEASLLGQRDAHQEAKLGAVLFMARLCQSLGNLCPHLKQCILGKSGSLDPAVREHRSAKKIGKGKVQEMDPVMAKWQDVKDKLLNQSLAAYRIWSSAVVNVLVHSFTQTLLQEAARSILATATNWDEIEIQEETESGAIVTSKIRLPVQPSWYVQSLLFNLCQEVNRVGGHALPKVTLQDLLRGCLTQTISSYEKLYKDKPDKETEQFPMTQNRALQLLYDLRYLNIVLGSRSEDAKLGKSKPESSIQKVVDFLEGHIDPFDLDVFLPHLNGNLTRLAQRTSVLFGLLTDAESPYASRNSTFSSQEPHNILPLASSQIRFGLLPLSMSSSRKAKYTAGLSQGPQRQAATSSKEEPEEALLLFVFLYEMGAPHQQRNTIGGSSQDYHFCSYDYLGREDMLDMKVPPPAVIRTEETFQPGSLFKQLATQDEDMSSTPSLFKLGWLSSMTK